MMKNMQVMPFCPSCSDWASPARVTGRGEEMCVWKRMQQAPALVRSKEVGSLDEKEEHPVKVEKSPSMPGRA